MAICVAVGGCGRWFCATCRLFCPNHGRRRWYKIGCSERGEVGPVLQRMSPSARENRRAQPLSASVNLYNSIIAGSPMGNGYGYIENVLIPAIPVGYGFLPIYIPAGREIIPSPSPNGSNTRRVSGPRCHL